MSREVPERCLDNKASLDNIEISDTAVLSDDMVLTNDSTFLRWNKISVFLWSLRLSYSAPQAFNMGNVGLEGKLL